MAPYLTLYNGRLLATESGTALQLSDSVADPCCCSGCNDQTIKYPCTITVIHVDENRCEDDVFAVYVVGADGERFIRELDLVSSPRGCCNSSCPQTRIEFPITLRRQDFYDDCTTTIEARFVRANCCSTATRLTIVAATGDVIVGTIFGPGGYSQTFTAETFCGRTASAP